MSPWRRTKRWLPPDRHPRPVARTWPSVVYDDREPRVPRGELRRRGATRMRGLRSLGQHWPQSPSSGTARKRSCRRLRPVRIVPRALVGIRALLQSTRCPRRRGIGSCQDLQRHLPIQLGIGKGTIKGSRGPQLARTYEPSPRRRKGSPSTENSSVTENAVSDVTRIIRLRR